MFGLNDFLCSVELVVRIRKGYCYLVGYNTISMPHNIYYYFVFEYGPRKWRGTNTRDTIVVFVFFFILFHSGL